MHRGAIFIVPAVACFEVARELERTRNSLGLNRLDAFSHDVADRYLTLTDSALKLAAKLWARARNAGTPTADPKELDCDVLIAAQALTMGIPASGFTIATTNVGHLSQFAPADLWQNILS